MTTYISFEEIKNIYDDFKKSLPEDKFERYYKELKILRSMISSAKNEGKDIDYNSLERIIKQNLAQLHLMGYKKIR